MTLPARVRTNGHTNPLELELAELLEELRRIHASHDPGHAAGVYKHVCMGCQMHKAVRDRARRILG